MREIVNTNRFLKDYKRIKKRGFKIAKLQVLTETLRTDQPLPQSVRPHSLSGKYLGKWDVHIESDWILIYEIDDSVLILRRTGTHADLFE